jgi:adenine-specific DNA methylase
VSIEDDFDIRFVAALALREKQIQQNYRPIIAVHKWFARRPGTLFRALLLAEFGEGPIDKLFYSSHCLNGVVVADPFMGGGTPLIEANRLGCDVVGFDINPMAAWIVREELEHLDLRMYRHEAESLVAGLATSLGDLYQTNCPIYGDEGVPVKYFLWVKTHVCEKCDIAFDLFPGYLIADNTRHSNNVLVCPSCGDLNEVQDPRSGGYCKGCRGVLKLEGPAKRGRCQCPRCGHVNQYPNPRAGVPQHRLFAIEYFNPVRKSRHAGRFFKKPDDGDLNRVAKAANLIAQLQLEFVPDDVIPEGDETNRLHRWGYQRYRDLFNARQLLGLELSCRRIANVGDSRIRDALATNLSDLLRYQNMLCRYDTTALKSLDIFSVHGFPVGLVQCESNILGITARKGTSVGSGGWRNIIEKYSKAKAYCDEPFEIRHVSGRKTIIPIADEWIGAARAGHPSRSIRIECANAANMILTEASLDAVMTDPPYFGNVQYGELMDFCYTWLRRLVSAETTGFSNSCSRSNEELTGNATQSRGLAHFAEGLASIFSVASKALKPTGPLVFTFHHNQVEAYAAVAMAILDARLICTASPPCPAEMSGSIHINGTASSITDTVFVCRKAIRRTAGSLQAAVEADVGALSQSGMRIHLGDIRCVAMGHATRLATISLHQEWDRSRSTKEKLHAILEVIGNWESVLTGLPTSSIGKRSAIAHDRSKSSSTRSLF